MPFLRRVVEEFEASLSPSDSRPSNASGKSERKRYGDGQERIKVKARDLDLPDGTPVQVLIKGDVYAELLVTDGRIRLDRNSSDGQIPRIATGDVLEIMAGGVRHLSGTYQPD